MNKQSKAAFWEGSDQSYEIMSRSHEERGKEIIALKARITELEKDNKQLRKNMKWQTDGWKKSSDLVVKDGVTIATLREALEEGQRFNGEESLETFYVKWLFKADKALQAVKEKE